MLSYLLHGPLVRLCTGLACLLSLWNTVPGIKGGTKKEKGIAFLPIPVPGPRGEERKEKGVAFVATTEIPAKLVDLSALNLTELVNGMLSRALRDNKKFFSLLSITSYSSFTFHKFSVAIYNISNLKTVDPTKFPTRYCHCWSYRTNDLSDFTALLVDVIGNSASYLTELFKSTSILSVSQTNGSDCIFICMMTGKSGRNLADIWDMAEKSPVIHYTFTSSVSGILGESTSGMAMTSKPTTTSQPRLPSTSPQRQGESTGVSALRTSPWIQTTIPSEAEDTMTTGRFLELPLTATTTWCGSSHTLSTKRVTGTPWVGSTRLLPSAQIIGTYTLGTQTPRPAKAPAPKYPQTGELPTTWPFTPGDEPALVLGLHQLSRCPQLLGCSQLLLREGAMTAVPFPLAIQKLNPCLIELCRFFQQCLCTSQSRSPRTKGMRYCLEHYSWFLKNATYICQRVKRVSHSHTLKQKCLDNICKSV
ncbi:LOW QUALITY PROTEIN: HERV-H LTR-associating protein 1 [Trichechus manatus latirostris]|uniref:LOW QUALITY PROTEIN: HERV-H LTR-associating protein 1 n=1 Tax=Trichechus manatus latirostris TaxID=127582 RepID=A0A2Y9DEU4_TRIMA|nr:LOW QUALITY PROTEIN: HERV-H LTR-associating protein 1 [Trichechus manatus latirostris]